MAVCEALDLLKAMPSTMSKLGLAAVEIGWNYFNVSTHLVA